MPGTVLNTLHMFSHLILTTMCVWNDAIISLTSQLRKLGHREVK